MNSLTPNIFVKDMDETIEFYKKIGFEVSMKVPDEGELTWVMMTCEDVSFMFQTFDSIGSDLPSISRRDGGSLLLYIQVKNIRRYHNRIKGYVNLLKDLETTFYGATEFSILDNNGFVLTFAEMGNE